MSAQAQSEGADTPKRRGLGKYVQRMRTVLRSGTRHPRESASAPAAAGSSSKPAATSQTATTDPTSKPTTTAAAPTEERTRRPGVTTVSRAQIEQDRARRLAEKYGLTIEPHEWASPNLTAERIEKPIRMRIHRTCHKCGTTFGSAKVCMNCEHTRCTKCPRYPVKKNKDAGDTGGKGKDVIGVVSSGGAGALSEEKKFKLTRPSRTGGQDLVRKKPMQRIRRSCHGCGELFLPGNKICPGCSHVRCVECPRDPPKPHLYPDGYPGDDPAPNSIPVERIKHPTRFKCHSCSTTFARGSTTCGDCSHEKCENCPRVPPKKLKHREFDADLIRRVEERLAALTVTASQIPSA